MIYEIIRWSRDLDSDFTLKDCLFGAVKIFLHGNLGGFQKKNYNSPVESGNTFAPKLTFIHADAKLAKKLKEVV